MTDARLLFKVFLRSFSLQALWNFERMQNAGFVYGLLPLFRKLYPDPEQRKEIIMRHLGFFNTNPYMAPIIFGLVMSMERDISGGRKLSHESVVAVRTNIAGPLGAIGDNFFWATWRPFTALLSISLILLYYDYDTLQGTWLAPLFFLVTYNMIHLPFRYWSLVISYRHYDRIIKVIADLEFQRAVRIIRIIGLAVLLMVLVLYGTEYLPTASDITVACAVLAVSIVFNCLRISPGIILVAIALGCVGLSMIGIR
jgi:PTS system mannose-specific IID component